MLVRPSVPCSLFPVPCSLFPVPCSLLPVACCLLPKWPPKLGYQSLKTTFRWNSLYTNANLAT